jgi:hypothetical protein
MIAMDATFQSEDVSISTNSGLPRALEWRLSLFLLLVTTALLTTSCGTVAQANGSQTNPNPNNLNVYGNLPTAKVHESYNAVLAVGGGNFPYVFSVKSGELPPGITLNPNTGALSGKPSTTGTFAFDVIVTDAPKPDQGSKSFVIQVANNGGNGAIQVTVSPSTATLVSAQKQQFTAAVSGTSNTAVTWSATTGTVSVNGLYTAPTVQSQTSATVTATSVADSSKSASALVTVEPANNQSLRITTGSLPEGQQGDTYSAVFAASGGATPYRWSISAGTPPPGLALNGSGDFTGLPTAAGTYSFTVTVTDAAASTASASYSVPVVAGGNFDGPAELPRATVPTAMSDTPAPGSVIAVNAGGDLQAAMNNAHCGDTISLQAGATFTGKFIVPAKGCDNNHWIIIRTSSPDSALPSEGQRLTPCYGGVASLVGRPQYPCPNPKNVLAKVQIQSHGDGPFQFADGANYYRFIGLEITRPVGAPGAAKLMSGQGTLDHLVVDRSWLHGQPQDETHNGVNLSGATNSAVIDSYLNDFHCVSVTGQCIDAHAVSGGVSDTQDGPFKIQDNFLEASGEAIMFGGGPATLTPTDIQIIGNHFWKPWQWMKGSPNFVGGTDGNPFIVKNHLELKNAVRVLIEANLMENCWGGFSQTGYGILLTPKNQHTQQGPNVCPLCQVTDVTIRYSHISHGGAGIQMATTISKDGAPALAGARWSIHDVVIDDLNTKYLGGGTPFEVLNLWPKNALNNVTINHVTAFPDPTSHMMIVGNTYKDNPMTGFVFSNNMIVTGAHPIWNTGGGQDSCAYYDIPVISIKECFTTYTFSNNALIATPDAFPPSKWPTVNLFPASVADAGFVNYNNGNGGNYELQANSPYKGKGTDGKDLGADIVGLNAALANVE